MEVATHTQAILLLTSYFDKASNSKEKPLTPTEWGRFAKWLYENNLTPESLLSGNLHDKLEGWSDKNITKERLEYLLNRGSALALACEKWLRAGLWVITRTDADYPKRLKKHLKYDSPALLFGCGNRALLNQGGIAVVGSRKTSDEDLKYSRDLGIKASNEGCSIVSGGARGIDEAAMLGALESEGTVIGVLADSLLRASSSAKYRKHLMNHNLVLISSFYPEAGFNVGNAMQRNKYIYCLSDAAVAVHSGTKGGTWTGALENIKKNHVPMWVKETKDKESGNAALVTKGAKWLTADISKVDFSVLTKLVEATNNTEADDLFSQSEASISASSIEEKSDNQKYNKENRQQSKAEQDTEKTSEIKSIDQQPIQSYTGQPAAEQVDIGQSETSFYQLFLSKTKQLCQQEAKSVDELLEAMELSKSQLDSWLKQAVAEEKVIKLNRPVRYQWHEEQQESLFK